VTTVRVDFDEREARGLASAAALMAGAFADDECGAGANLRRGIDKLNFGLIEAGCEPGATGLEIEQ
jgi:hypothetical protein